ncbi:hypothetical protein DXV75_06105 [Alteromonas aestuariivivens]|uniref:Fucosyltransferase C-terminal domain-containing protein n=1 Tax=Alteromonas aestuariivivens TaxID=1938339 RepID=A0A3D8M9C3_9ALTE|nr:glycosyltransferase family 10 [Alteromonas aestuariivivens]RDV26566.1 hypothetical protein DXV75_06105 [Alteromonas aestuariivivens]
MSKINVCLFGRHSNRTPLVYSEYQQLFNQYINYVDDVKRADLVVLGFSVDLKGLIEEYGPLLKTRDGIRILVLSEEPLWDLLSNNDPLTNKSTWTNGEEEYEFFVANFFNSNVFKFKKVPYFLTTESFYFARYAYELTHFVNDFNEGNLRKHWAALNTKVCFLQQRRFNNVVFSNKFGNLALSSYRTNLAELLANSAANVYGLGWGNCAPRQTLPDWHLDKIVKFKNKFPLFSALENTLLSNYITEKIFDAFALRSVPLYFANSNHRVFELVEEESVVNLFGSSENSAKDVISNWHPNQVNMEAYYTTVCKLQSLFSDPENLHSERHRVVREVLGILHTVCS